MSSSEVFEHLRTRLPLPYATSKERRWTHNKIRRQLREFVKKRAVDGSPVLIHGERMWLWIRMPENDQADEGTTGPA
jgi:hypothetical protein